MSWEKANNQAMKLSLRREDSIVAKRMHSFLWHSPAYHELEDDDLRIITKAENRSQWKRAIYKRHHGSYPIPQ